jgi:hypothetical protein
LKERPRTPEQTDWIGQLFGRFDFGPRPPVTAVANNSILSHGPLGATLAKPTSDFHRIAVGFSFWMMISEREQIRSAVERTVFGREITDAEFVNFTERQPALFHLVERKATGRPPDAPSLTARRPDYDVGFIVAPLSTNSARCSGLVAALVVVDLDRPDTHKLSLYLGADLRSLARRLVEKMEREFFQAWR